MKAKEIEVGKVYVARVSSRLVRVRVLRMVEKSSVKKRWRGINVSPKEVTRWRTEYVVRNETTGRQLVFKSVQRFRRSVLTMRELAAEFERLAAASLKASEADAGLDGGEFSGPAHSERLQRQLEQLAADNGTTPARIEAALCDRELRLEDVATASLNQCRDELAAAGQSSQVDSVQQARRDVAVVLHENFGPFDLCDSDTNDTIRDATVDEVVASVDAGPEGHILVDGRRCYVRE